RWLMCWSAPCARLSGPDRRHQWSHTEDRYHSLQVIGRYRVRRIPARPDLRRLSLAASGAVPAPALRRGRLAAWYRAPWPGVLEGILRAWKKVARKKCPVLREGTGSSNSCIL